MARALRVVSVERGADPRRYALLPFGGAGPMHAAAVADELGMTRVLCPPASGVLAALGLVVGERRRDVQRSVLRRGDELSDEALAGDWAQLGEQARDELGDPRARLRGTFELRYAGQAFELPVSAPTRPPPAADLREAFEAAHEERYGYRDRDGEVELVTLRVTAAVPGPRLDLEAAAADEGGQAGDPAGERRGDLRRPAATRLRFGTDPRVPARGWPARRSASWRGRRWWCRRGGWPDPRPPERC